VWCLFVLWRSCGLWRVAVLRFGWLVGWLVNGESGESQKPAPKHLACPLATCRLRFRRDAATDTPTHKKQAHKQDMHVIHQLINTRTYSREPWVQSAVSIALHICLLAFN
jgi:hypothetical protein